MTENTQTPKPEAPNLGEMLRTMPDHEIVGATGLQAATVADRRENLVGADGEILQPTKREVSGKYAGMLATQNEAEVDTIPRRGIIHTD